MRRIEIMQQERVEAVGAIADAASLLGEIRRLQEEAKLLRGAIDAQDQRERDAGIVCGLSYEEHGCDWPDAAAEKITWLRHVVACVQSAVDNIADDSLRTKLQTALRGVVEEG